MWKKRWSGLSPYDTIQGESFLRSIQAYFLGKESLCLSNQPGLRLSHFQRSTHFHNSLRVLSVYHEKMETMLLTFTTIFSCKHSITLAKLRTGLQRHVIAGISSTGKSSLVCGFCPTSIEFPQANNWFDRRSCCHGRSACCARA